MKAIQLFYIFIASFSLSFILSCIYFKIFGRKRADNSYCKAITLALDNAKDEKFFKTKRELDIAEMHKKYNLSEDEWMFESCNFTNIYDYKPTEAIFKNIHTGERRYVNMWE